MPQQHDRLPSEILDRLPPQNLDAEKSVLGSIILDPRVFGGVAAIVQGGDFYADANARLFRCLEAMDAAGKRIDVALLAHALRKAGEYEAVGGAAYIAELAQSVPYTANAEHYARIVAEKASRRAVIHAATQALREAWDETQPINEAIDSLESSLAKVRTGETAEVLIDATAAAVKTLDYIDVMQARGAGCGVFTGLEKFDLDTGGLHRAEYIVFAGQASSGKTALAVQIADYNAAHDRLVYFASCEMEAEELTLRPLSAMARVNSRSVRNGSLSTEDRSRLIEAASEFSSTRKMYIDPRPYLKVFDIRRAARQLVKQGLSLVVVDYLGLLEPDDTRIPREQQVARISRGLKNLAKELGVPLLALCQLNRENLPDERPSLRHLRESGAIGQDAHMVAFIYRPAQGIIDEEPAADGKRGRVKVQRAWPAELILAKNRNGPTGAYRLDWHPEQTRFSCWDGGF